MEQSLMDKLTILADSAKYDPVDSILLPKIKVEVIVSKISVDSVVEAAKKALYTGHIGDGKIFVYNVTRVVKIRTGEEDFAALQDVE